MTTQDEIVFYHAVPSRSAIVHWMLEEIGAPYRTRILDLRKGENRSAEYLAINPMGKVPAISHRGAVVTETAAICCYLADAFPAAGLAVPIGTPQRGVYLKWLFFATSCLGAAIVDRLLKRGGPRETLEYGDFDLALKVVGDAVARSPFLAGEQFTAADIMIGATVHWGMMMKAIPEQAPLAAYRDRVLARPAFRRSFERDMAAAGSREGR